MARMLIFGLGYSAGRLRDRLAGEGWHVVGTSRDGRDGTLRFDDRDAVTAAIAAATHILSSVPPVAEIAAAPHILSSVPPVAESDPVLVAYGAALARRGAWLGYLSSTGVYGDAGGAWIDETAATGGGRRGARARADADWLAIGARVFRLPGIYGPGRSPIDRVRAGEAHRVDAPGQVFSRVHVDDIVAGVIAGFDGPAGAYNLADDLPCSPNDVVDLAARLIGRPSPPLVSLADLSPMARGFYAENRRVANGKAKRVLGWTLRWPDYRLGLRALSATTSPSPVSAAPPAASVDQR